MVSEVVVERSTLIDLKQSIKHNKFVQKCLDLFDNDDFFTFQKLIKANAGLFCFRKKEFSAELRQVLELVMNCSDSKSAAFISLIWEEFKLWNDVALNVTVVSHVHVTKSTNIRTLFSLLMFDWHNPDQGDEDVFYFLDSKFKQYENVTEKSLFCKLYETIDGEESNYKHICLMIIYQFLYELNGQKDCKEKIFGNLQEVMKVNDVLDMKDKEFAKKILKVFVAYWYKSDDNYRSGNEILYERLMEMSPFFELAFMLKEKLTSTFEKKFQKYIEQCKKNHGFYYEAKLKVDNRLLLHIAKQNKFTQIRSFIFRKCPFNEINATPLTNVQEISKILNLNIYPWSKREEDRIVSLWVIWDQFYVV